MVEPHRSMDITDGKWCPDRIQFVQRIHKDVLLHTNILFSLCRSLVTSSSFQSMHLSKRNFPV
uniref:Predicted protein n=1 Tax=Hordeum vulgare subsp. vulgare TaxID=112509 RepID=F2DZG0_HORVV|nr:predicted protein [Hordeum vulgare subsp. vulgare]